MRQALSQSMRRRMVSIALVGVATPVTRGGVLLPLVVTGGERHTSQAPQAQTRGSACSKKPNLRRLG
jgi:nitrous oxide reductase